MIAAGIWPALDEAVQADLRSPTQFRHLGLARINRVPRNLERFHAGAPPSMGLGCWCRRDIDHRARRGADEGSVPMGHADQGPAANRAVRG